MTWCTVHVRVRAIHWHHFAVAQFLSNTVLILPSIHPSIHPMHVFLKQCIAKPAGRLFQSRIVILYLSTCTHAKWYLKYQ
jgi:hypothetical protein